METQTSRNPRIETIEKDWTPDKKIFVYDNKGNETAFVYPSFRGNYVSAGKEALSHNLRLPTSEEIASLVHAAYCSNLKDKPEFQDVRNIMKKAWIWVFNRNLWTSEGVYVVHDSKAVGRNQPLNINALEKSLKGAKEVQGIRFGKNGKVRFATKGSYKLEDNTPEELSKNGFVVASYGIEGAEKLGEVASKFTIKPYVFGLNIQEKQEPELRFSALDEGYDGGRLCVWTLFDNGRSGHAFGVFK